MEAYLAEIARFSAETFPIDNGDGSPITPKQQQLLQQMQSKLKDVLNPDLHNHRFVARFLAAEGFHLDKAVVMLRHHLEWRQKVKAERPLSLLLEEIPEHVQKYAAAPFRAGEDVDGRPVYWDAPGGVDVDGMMMSCRAPDVVRYHGFVFMESVYNDLREQTVKHDRLIDKMVVVQDMNGFGLRSHRKLMTILSQVTTMRNENYPQILKRLVVINAPRVIDMAFNLVKPLLRERTRKKIQFVRGANVLSCLKEFLSE